MTDAPHSESTPATAPIDPEPDETRTTGFAPTGTKLSVVGAGSVGASLAYAAIIRGAVQQVALYDLNTKKVDAEVKDLAHGTQYTQTSNVIGGDDISVVAGSDVVVITAGAKQRPGQTRLELAGTNVDILRSLLPQLLEQAPDAVYVLVTNPVDVLTYAAQKISGLPAGRVLGSGTLLDTSRLRRQLAERAGVAQSSVHAVMMGEHGDSEFPAWSTATIGPTPIREWSVDGTPLFTDEVLEATAKGVVNAAYEIIEGKGATNLAIGLAGTRLVEAIVRDEHLVLQLSTVLENYKGISDVALSVPSLVGRGGVQRVLDLPMTPGEVELLHRSATTLRAEIDRLGL